jgi:hypothetical protein
LAPRLFYHCREKTMQRLKEWAEKHEGLAIAVQLAVCFALLMFFSIVILPWVKDVFGIKGPSVYDPR